MCSNHWQDHLDGHWQDGLEVRTLTSKLSSLGLNPDPAINYHPGVSQAGRFILLWAFPRMDVKLGHPIYRHQLVGLKYPTCPPHIAPVAYGVTGQHSKSAFAHMQLYA